MSQVRYVNFGDTLTASLVGTLTSTLASPGRYGGYDVVVIDAQTIEMQNKLDPSGRVGYVLLPDGVIVSESVPVRIVFPVFPSSATTYTILARHVDTQLFGGSAVTYVLQSGLVQQSSLTDATVIAWVFYPGAGVGLSSYQIVQPPLERLDSFAALAGTHLDWNLLAPFAEAITTPAIHHSVTAVLGSLGSLQTGTSWPQLRIDSAFNTVGTETSILRFARRVAARPSFVTLMAQIDTGCTMQVSIVDSTGSAVYVTPASFAGTNPAAWAQYQVRIPPYTPAPAPVQNGTFVPGTLWCLELRVNQPLSKTSLLGAISCSFDPTLAV